MVSSCRTKSLKSLNLVWWSLPPYRVTEIEKCQVKNIVKTHKSTQIVPTFIKIQEIKDFHCVTPPKKTIKTTGKTTLSWLLHLPGILVKDEWRKMWREAKRWRHVRRGREAPGKKHGGETWPGRFHVIFTVKNHDSPTILVYLIYNYPFWIFWQRNVDDIILIYNYICDSDSYSLTDHLIISILVAILSAPLLV